VLPQVNLSQKETDMICPHCHETIREEQKYLMSRDENAEIPRWAAPALWVLLFLIVVATLTLFSHAIPS
jgi:hypothetical protein